MLREATVQAGWLVLNEQDHQLHRVEQDCNLTGSLILMSSLKGFLGSFNSVWGFSLFTTHTVYQYLSCFSLGLVGDKEWVPDLLWWSRMDCRLIRGDQEWKGGSWWEGSWGEGSWGCCYGNRGKGCYRDRRWLLWRWEMVAMVMWWGCCYA